MLEDILIISVSTIFLVSSGWWFVIKHYAPDWEAKRKIDKARKEAERLSQLSHNNPHPMIQIAASGKVIYVNPAAKRVFPDLEDLGFRHKILENLRKFELLAIQENNQKIMKREVEWEGRLYHQTIMSTGEDSHAALVAYCYEITEIKEVQKKARLMEAAIENAHDGVIITTADVNEPQILYVNDAVQRMSGYEKEELIGKTPRILQGGGTDKQTLEKLKGALKQGKSFNGELRNYTKDGISYWLDISIVPVKDDDGRVTHFAAIERDITGRMAFEKEMQINREAAEVANRAKDDFLANMSHELRTPMNGIIGLSDLLMEMDVGHEKNELVEAINTSSRNLLILLNDILDLSKIEAGELTLENIPYGVRRTVTQAVDLLKPIASRKGVVLESAINPIVPEKIIGDPARLQQIMNNLISNAIKFTEAGHVRIDVTTARDHVGDPELHIRVEDSGIGIAEDKRELIFQKFTQADVSTARKYGGTGLGLCITKELIEMMGGEISFDSVEGKGTTFYVKIPIEIVSKEYQEMSLQPKENVSPINTNAKLLVVDDHPVNLLFMRKVLKKLGFSHVDEACTGLGAIEKTEQDCYDLIFMDCQMPEMDGFEASTIIREREELIGDIKIIAVTADAMKGAREKCIDAGMNDYISKPVDIEKLKSILGEWIPGEEDQHVSSGNEQIDVENITECRDESSRVLDWERLRMFTEDDPDEERALIEMFTTHAEESLDVLKMQCLAGDNEEWRKAAHKLKGSAANLGANILSEECLEAEKAFELGEDEKSKIFDRMFQAYLSVYSVLNEKSINTTH